MRELHLARSGDAGSLLLLFCHIIEFLPQLLFFLAKLIQFERQTVRLLLLVLELVAQVAYNLGQRHLRQLALLLCRQLHACEISIVDKLSAFADCVHELRDDSVLANQCLLLCGSQVTSSLLKKRKATLHVQNRFVLFNAFRFQVALVYIEVEQNHEERSQRRFSRLHRVQALETRSLHAVHIEGLNLLCQLVALHTHVLQVFIERVEHLRN